jgi:hypothetical protein
VDDVRDRLRHVRWIGGGSGGGKSVLAQRLAAQYDLRLYALDDVMGAHAARTTAADSPRLHEFIAMDMDQRWLLRPPEVMLDTFHWYRGEGFGLIVEDLLALPDDRIVIVEGFRALPELVQPLLSFAGQAVWLLPTADFREYAFDKRDTKWQIAGKTSDPPTALANLLERDHRFTERLRAESARLGLPVLEVSATISEDEVAGQVAELMRLGRPELGDQPV